MTRTRIYFPSCLNCSLFPKTRCFLVCGTMLTKLERIGKYHENYYRNILKDTASYAGYINTPKSIDEVTAIIALCCIKDPELRGLDIEIKEVKK